MLDIIIIYIYNYDVQAPDHAGRMARFALECVREAAATRIDDSDPAAGTVKIRAGFHSGPVVGQVREKESSKVSISKLKEQKDNVAV